MAISLFWGVKTDEFDSWLNPDPDVLAQMIQPQGVLSFSVHRGADYPNSVTVLMQFADRGAVDAFEAWYATSKIEWMKQFPASGHEVVERWLGHEVPGYTRRLG